MLEVELHKLLLQDFYNGTLLADKARDFTARPNVFLAHYAYPILLTKKGWQSCFAILLPKLWLPWGGLATIDTSHSLFQASSTGENPASYHHGDSWFWINNYAALALSQVNKKYFAPHIRNIVRESIADLIVGTVAGHSSETHSGLTPQQYGAPAQAWSASTLLELLMHLGSSYKYEKLLESKRIQVHFNNSRNAKDQYSRDD